MSIECQEHPLKTVLSIYETANFTLAGRLFDDDNRLFFEEIEYDEDKGSEYEFDVVQCPGTQFIDDQQYLRKK